MPTSSRLATRPRSVTRPAGRLGDAAQDLEQRALAGAVAADDAEHLALLDLEADILQRPELLDLVALDDLPAAHDVDGLARDIARLAAKHVAQRRVVVALAALGPMAEEVASSRDFRRR